MFSDLVTEWNVPTTSSNLDKQLFSSKTQKMKKASPSPKQQNVNEKPHLPNSNPSMSAMMMKSFGELDSEQAEIKKKQRKKKNKKNKFKKSADVTSLPDKTEENSGEETGNDSEVTVKSKTKKKAAKRKLEAGEESTSPSKKTKLDEETKHKAKKPKKKKEAMKDVNSVKSKVKNDESLDKVADNASGDGVGKSSKTLRYREKKRRRQERARARKLLKKSGGANSKEPGAERTAIDSSVDTVNVSKKLSELPSVVAETSGGNECRTVDSDHGSPTLKKRKRKKPKKKKSSDDTKSETNSSPIEARIGESSPMSKVKKFHLASLRKALAQDEVGVEVPDVAENRESSSESSSETSPDGEESGGTGLRERMVDKLSAARFRFLNEKLYTSTGDEAYRLFKEDPTSYRVYHHGYSRQVQLWPSNPCDVIINIIKKLPPSSIVADFGCGEAKIAKSVPNKVHSFDLKAACAGVTECNMTKVPLPQSSVDVAVYCLSLMGTDMVDYLAEGNRVLKKGGLLLIAEVRSRFSNDIKHFIKGVEKLGFKVQSKDLSNKMFVLLKLTKTANVDRSKPLPEIELSPCVYKKR